jgi:sugar lactone lactonase YvrE
MRDLDSIDSERQLVAALRRAARERGGPLPAIDVPDALLDERPLKSVNGLSPYGSNDIVADGRGNVYVDNVNFNFAAGPPEGEPAPGFVALVTPDGEARNVARDLSFPNGMAVTADNSTLVVAESYRHRLTASDIGADGSLANRRVWAEVGHHSPDGICLDTEGSVWYADVGDRYCVRVS